MYSQKLLLITNKCGLNSKLLKIVCFLVPLFVCTYLINDRVQAYNLVPTTSSITFQKRDSLRFPPLILCRFGFNLKNFEWFFHNEVNRRCGINPGCKIQSRDNKTIFPLEKLGFDMDYIWDNFGVQVSFVNVSVYCPFVKNASNCHGDTTSNYQISKMRGLLGTCVKLLLNEEYQFHGYYSSFNINVRRHNSTVIPGANRKTTDIFLFIPSDPKFSIHELFFAVRPIPKYSQMEVELKIQTFKFLNLSKRRCLDYDHLVKCIDDCFQNLLFQRISCRLPFLPPGYKPNCTTYNEAVNAYREVFKVYKSMRVEKCHCPRTCNASILVATIKVENRYVKSAEYPTSVNFRFETNIERIVDETYSYPLAALISDIGGIIGFFLGISIFTTFQGVINSIALCQRRCIKRKRGRLIEVESKVFNV